MNRIKIDLSSYQWIYKKFSASKTLGTGWRQDKTKLANILHFPRIINVMYSKETILTWRDWVL